MTTTNLLTQSSIDNFVFSYDVQNSSKKDNRSKMIHDRQVASIIFYHSQNSFVLQYLFMATLQSLYKNKHTKKLKLPVLTTAHLWGTTCEVGLHVPLALLGPTGHTSWSHTLRLSTEEPLRLGHGSW